MSLTAILEPNSVTDQQFRFKLLAQPLIIRQPDSEYTKKIGLAKLCTSLQLEQRSSDVSSNISTENCGVFAPTRVDEEFEIRKFAPPGVETRFFPFQLDALIEGLHTKKLTKIIFAGSEIFPTGQRWLDKQRSTIAKDFSYVREFLKFVSKDATVHSNEIESFPGSVIVDDGQLRTRLIRTDHRRINDWHRRLQTLHRHPEQYLRVNPPPGWACGLIKINPLDDQDFSHAENNSVRHCFVRRLQYENTADVSAGDWAKRISEQIKIFLQGTHEDHAYRKPEFYMSVFAFDIQMQLALEWQRQNETSLKIHWIDHIFGWNPLATFASAMGCESGCALMVKLDRAAQLDLILIKASNGIVGTN